MATQPDCSDPATAASAYGAAVCRSIELGSTWETIQANQAEMDAAGYHSGGYNTYQAAVARRDARSAAMAGAAAVAPAPFPWVQYGGLALAAGIGFYLWRSR